MDLSFGMLQKAIKHEGTFFLINGDINFPPFLNNCFEMVFCINALQHFNDPYEFILNAHNLLKQNGALTVIGMNPHTKRDQWFIYDYFPGTYETDLERYPSPGTIVDWMISAGFKDTHWQVGERIVDHRRGIEVLPLSKDFTSQLSLLTRKEYDKGITRIEKDLQEAEASGEVLKFSIDISLAMVTGRVNER
jgi:ubiquinone/menaquinone biosynthesis C-methylase UbiE